MKIVDAKVITFRKDTWMGADKDCHMHPCNKRQGAVSVLEICTDEGISGYFVTRDTWWVPTKDFNPEAIHDENLATFVMSGGGKSLEASVNKIKPVLIGENPLCRERIFNKIFRMQRIGGGAPLGDEILRMIDSALWDLFGRMVNLPVFRILGGHRTRIPAYGSIMVGDDFEGGLDTPEAYGKYALKLKERGYRGIKLHTWMDEKWGPSEIAGQPDMERDLNACRAVREAVGPDMPLFLDPFHNYSRLDTLHIGKELEKLNFEWLEEPMDEYDIESYRWLCRNLELPILGPETAHGKGQTRAEWIRSGACDILRAGVQDVGGITPIMKIIHMAELNGINCELHGGGADTIQVLAAMNIPGKYYERGLLHPFIDYDGNPPWLKEPVDVMDENGYIIVSEKPGMGFELNWDYINDNLL